MNKLAILLAAVAMSVGCAKVNDTKAPATEINVGAIAGNYDLLAADGKGDGQADYAVASNGAVTAGSTSVGRVIRSETTINTETPTEIEVEVEQADGSKKAEKKIINVSTIKQVVSFTLSLDAEYAKTNGLEGATSELTFDEATGSLKVAFSRMEGEGDAAKKIDISTLNLIKIVAAPVAQAAPIQAEAPVQIVAPIQGEAAPTIEAPKTGEIVPVPTTEGQGEEAAK